MSASDKSLAGYYIRSHPDAAARVLELHPPEASAGFLAALEAQLGASLLQRMLPHYAGQMAAHFQDDTLAALLDHVEASFAAAVLRCLSAARREAVLGLLTTARRAATVLLLNFPEDAVGSWMSPHIVTLPDDCDIETARKYIKLGGEQTLVSDTLFVVDRDRQVAGYASLAELTRASKKAPLQSIVQQDIEALPARMSLHKAVQHDFWSQVDIMPVINRSQQFIGAIRHVDLRSGLEQLTRASEFHEPDNPLNGLFSAYGTTLFTLFGAVEDALAGKDGKGGRK